MNRCRSARFLFLHLDLGKLWSKSSRPACVIPTCTRPMAIGRSNRLRHLSPDMKVLVLWWRSARVSLT